ncbi:leukotriene B4 receptor 1-like [Hypomesus transpacificus]|uniref:leukotriene B4 receptor 1-like n=1 Tax=Hypomesus transpacificus TaxID=137520 RepID=UPI001F0867CD|nr:leukotriene B4 receptor 1-like [Hypomesus transpacificus]
MEPDLPMEMQHPYWHISRIAPSVIMAFCVLLGIPGNLAVVVVVVRNLERGNFTLRLMLNLALCDLLVLLCLPLVIYNLQKNWDLGPELCKTLFLLLHGGLNASVLTITLLSVQRYIQVLYPQNWARLGRLGEEALLLFLWGLAGLIACPSLLVRDISTKSLLSSCSSHYPSRAVEMSVLLLQTVVGFLMPCCILGTSYFFLHRRVSLASQLRQQRLTKLVGSIMVSFFSCWAPLHLFNMLAAVNVALKNKELYRVCEIAWDFLIACSTFNSCLNPFLYAFASSDFRRDHPQPTST